MMALLFSCNNETGKNRNHSTIHGHRYTDLVQGNRVKQDFHILNAVNRHPGFADIPLNPWMVAVISAMGCQIKRHGDTLLTRRQSASIERVGFFRRREPGILPNGPRPPSIHRGFNTPGERRLPRDPPHMIEISDIIGGVDRLDLDAL